MQIVYIIKKGLQNFPPCLSQVLILNDMGVDIVVYHGINSAYINGILDERGIAHYTLNSDDEKKGLVSSVLKFIKYTKEMKKIIGRLQKSFLWFGNVESVITLGSLIKSHSYVCTCLELHGQSLHGLFHQSMVNIKADLMDKLFKRKFTKTLQCAKAVVCCEAHRAAIMQSVYSLKKIPYTLPNKPYDLIDADQYKMPIEISELSGKFIILYQGIIDPERPLYNIAVALSEIGDDNIVFMIMGKAVEKDGLHIVEELKKQYKNTKYIGYIPSPQHLSYTKYANIGIAVYDNSCLNTIFCAPNKTYEYAKFGVPMLCSNNIGLQETVGIANAGVCVNYDNTEEIRNGFKKIIEKYDEYCNGAYKFYQSTDNKKTIEKILSHIQ